jgi:hypothetical protein
MKNEFIGFYVPTKEMLKAAWGSEKTLFIFDTNVLIKLYSYQSGTLDDFFSILEYLGERIWLPHQVGLEFQNRRLDIKHREKQKFQEIYNHLDEILAIETKINQKFLKGRFPSLDSSTEKLFKSIQKSIETFKVSLQECDSSQPNIRTHDEIREKLDTFFRNKIGSAYTQEKLNELYKDGEIRYSKEIPPGFKDSSKEGKDYIYRGVEYKRKFGDLILWKQIIEKAKNEKDAGKIENIIFITDDEKEDWWFCINQNGRKIIGPHANLTHEIIDEGGISLFHMYNTASFLEDAKEILSDIRIQESSILEVEKTNEAEKKLHTQQEEKVRKNNLSQELQKEELTSLALYYKNLRNMIQQQDHIREINNSIKHPWDEIFKQKEALSNIYNSSQLIALKRILDEQESWKNKLSIYDSFLNLPVDKSTDDEESSE